MLPPRLFRARAFSAGNAVVFLLNASLTGAIFLMPQFQQVVLGQDPLHAGLRLLPWGVVPFLIAPRAGALADRIGARPLVVTGLLAQAAGMAWIAAVAGPGNSYWTLVAPMCVSGAGLGLAIPALTRSATSTVAAADIGTASGAFSTMRQLGGAFGVAVLGAAFAATGSYASPSMFTSGFVTAAGVGAGMALAGAALGMILPRRGNRPAPAAAGAPERGRPVRGAGVAGDLVPGDLVPGDLVPGESALGDLALGDLAPGDAAGTAGHARGATR
jgi:predicted MFS family arabinose efflux permease